MNLPSLNNRLAQLLVDKPVILQLLRFAAIGALNTALDFIILNYVTKSFGITSGLTLGLINVVGFSAAIVQSYLWNRAWTFASTIVSPLTNAYRLVLVGGVGFLAFLAVIVGGQNDATPLYYLLSLLIFLSFVVILWMRFDFQLVENNPVNTGYQFSVFLLISIIGLIINSVIVAVASNFLLTSFAELSNVDTLKNISKILATSVSLIWNFVGYKMVVFKR